MKLHAIKAAEGDCLLLETGDTPPKFVLIDGGPAGIYDRYASAYLRQVAGETGRLEAIIVSHVDGDHILGVLDLLADVERQRANGEPTLAIGDVWHNSFAETIDTPDGAISQGVQAVLGAASAANVAMANSHASFLGIAEGAKLRRSAKRIDVPLNEAFGGVLLSPDRLEDATRAIGDVKLTVIGPTAANLHELQIAWLDWLKVHAVTIARGEANALANADKSIPNLSSIVLYAESGGRSLLLTGDARGDHILQGLTQAGLLNGQLRVNVLKVQHHGSDRNATKTFFEKVVAERYVISANGKNGNPDYKTLTWIVEAAVARGDSIEIFVTNEAPSLDQLRQSHAPATHGYALRVAQSSSMVVSI